MSAMYKVARGENLVPLANDVRVISWRFKRTRSLSRGGDTAGSEAGEEDEDKYVDVDVRMHVWLLVLGRISFS